MSRRQPPERQTQQIGQLWQYDASPHRWFPDQPARFHLLQALDDHSRLLPLARLYPAETLLAHFDYLPAAFLARGLPLALYYHSFFSPASSTLSPNSAGRCASTKSRCATRPLRRPRAKSNASTITGKSVSRRCSPPSTSPRYPPPTNCSPRSSSIATPANATASCAPHRSPPGRLALREKRSALRSAPKCPWWPCVWSVRSNARVAADGTIAIGSQRFAIDRPPGSSVVRCLHPNGDHSVLLHPPAHSQRPQLLLHLPHPS